MVLYVPSIWVLLLGRSNSNLQCSPLAHIPGTLPVTRGHNPKHRKRIRQLGGVGAGWILGPVGLVQLYLHRGDSNLAKVQLNINSKALVAHIDRVV